MQQRWVSLGEAAALEAAAGRPITKPTVCRYLKRHPEIPVQRSVRGDLVRKLDYGAFAAHRMANELVLEAHGQVAPQALPPEIAATAPGAAQDAFFAPPALGQPPAPQFAPSAALTPAARKTEAQAQKVELELAERTGRLVSRQAASRAVQDLSAAFAAALDKLERQLAARVVGVEDERQAQIVIRKECRTVRAELAERMRQAGRLQSAEAVTA